MKRPDFERCLCATEYSDGRTMFEDDYQNIMHIWSPVSAIYRKYVEI